VARHPLPSPMPWDSDPSLAVIHIEALTDPPLPPVPAFSLGVVVALEDVTVVVAVVEMEEGNDSSFPIVVDVVDAAWQPQPDNPGGRRSDADSTFADSSADIVVAVVAMPRLLFVRRGSEPADHCHVSVPQSSVHPLSRTSSHHHRHTAWPARNWTP